MTKTKNNNYTADDITVLSDREHCRLRIEVYFGSNELTEFNMPMYDRNGVYEKHTFSAAAFRALNEIIDNATDEVLQHATKKKSVEIYYSQATGNTVVSDSGRGVPISMYKDTGKYTPEIVFCSLKSGRNFGEREAGIRGMNGIGSSATNFMSSSFKVTSCRDGKIFTQEYLNGADTISKPKIVTTTAKQTGTRIEFCLDPAVFGQGKTIIPVEVMKSKAAEINLANPNIVVSFVDTDKGEATTFNNVAISGNDYTFTKDQTTVRGVIDIFGENAACIVNGSYMLLGASFVSQFNNTLVEFVQGELKSTIKAEGLTIQGSDCSLGVTLFASVPNVAYDSQSKTRAVGSIKPAIEGWFESNQKALKKDLKEWFEQVLDRARERAVEENRKKQKKDKKKTNLKGIENFIDASSPLRSICSIVLTEGLSAAASLCQVRDPEKMASLPLSGKVNNVYGMKPHQAAQLGKLTDIFSVCGLTPGEKATSDTLRYGRIVITTDADPDGSNIMTLLVNIFYTFWPELFDPANPKVFRLVSPNVAAKKGDEVVHFATMDAFNKHKDKYKNWTIKYFKGLGSLTVKDWKQVLSTDSNYHPIVSGEGMHDVLKLIFGPDADARKVWLQG